MNKTVRVSKKHFPDPFAAEIAARLAYRRQREAMREILAQQAKLNVLRPTPHSTPPVGLRERVGLLVEYA